MNIFQLFPTTEFPTTEFPTTEFPIQFPIQNTPFFFMMIFLALLYKFRIVDHSYKNIIKLKSYLNDMVFYKRNKVIPEITEHREETPEIKFEEKYLQQYNELSSDYYFTHNEKIQLSKKLEELNEKGEENTGEKAADFVFREKIKKLQNTFVMEYTPMGNVILTFNPEKDHFEYYSDATIPYRFLETVARKFIIMNNCKAIYIDMENELKIYEDNIKKIEAKKKAEKEAEKEAEKVKEPNYEKPKEKRDVFAKLKSYNKDLSTNRMGASQVIPPKNSQGPQSHTIQQDKFKPLILKEKSNSYSHKGKIQNFNLLKKIDKSVSNKKLKLSFSEYKNLMKNGNKIKT
jgi:hypothetical protein